jgi:PhnB protein
MAVKKIPEGFHAVTPYLTVPKASQVIEFLKSAFGAEEIERMMRPDGGVWHAEVRIGDSMIMLGEPRPGTPAMPASIYLYVPDCDAAYRSAVNAGAKSLMEPADQFYGDRNAGVEDTSGNRWWIAEHKEDVSREEMQRRAAEFAAKVA